MKIACLSGKGGAGKTFVAVNLAATLGDCSYVDCDVEEPNGRIFWKPENVKIQMVYKNLPSFNADKCVACKKCVNFCRFHALAFIKNKPILFQDVCHSCGVCEFVCPSEAVVEVKKPIGSVEVGKHSSVTVITGILNVGEASGVPVIKQALQNCDGNVVIDCPPGSACSVMETVMEADYCVLVVEPTAFGFHNFKMVYELVKLLDKNCGVVVNKETQEFQPLYDFCKENNIEILSKIKYQPSLAQKIANGEIVSELVTQEKDRFLSVLEKIGVSL